MKMKTRDVIEAVNANRGKGLLLVSGHSIPSEYYGSFFAFKRCVRKVYEGMANAEKELISELGIHPEDMVLQPNGSIKLSPKKKDGTPDISKLEKYRAGMSDLLEKEIDMSGVKKMPFEHYKALYDENCKEVEGETVDLLGIPIIENVIIESLFEICEQ